MSIATVVSEHARRQAALRGIDEAIVRAVSKAPEQVVLVRDGREIRQSRVPFPPDGMLYLVRVFVDVSPEVETVITVYRTRKTEKYWRMS